MSGIEAVLGNTANLDREGRTFIVVRVKNNDGCFSHFSTHEIDSVDEPYAVPVLFPAGASQMEVMLSREMYPLTRHAQQLVRLSTHHEESRQTTGSDDRGLPIRE